MARLSAVRGRGPIGPLRIALVAPPFIPIPPPGYAGTERVIALLATSLHDRGHDVTVFAPGDSDVPCRLVPIVPKALWLDGFHGNAGPHMTMALAGAVDAGADFDIIHSHVEKEGFEVARQSPVPVVSTLHGRLDVHGLPDVIHAFRELPLIAISESQRRWSPEANWVATIHHGLDFASTPTSTEPGEYLLVVGRISREKGVAEAIDVARRSGRRLVMAAKVYDPKEHELFAAIVQPAIDAGVVDWRGEVAPPERDRLMAGALATLMLGAWPEPFGLVAIESMATGTPVIARRAGGYTETVVHGVTGFLVDDVEEAMLAVSRADRLARRQVAAHARGRFSVDRMTSRYERAYAAVIAAHQPAVMARSGATRRREAVHAARSATATLDPGMADGNATRRTAVGGG